MTAAMEQIQSLIKSLTSNMDILITWMTAIIIYVVLLVVALWFYPDKYLIFLGSALGSSMGWVLGILATPYNSGESKQLSELTKVAYGFLSGFVLSKVGTVINTVISSPDYRLIKPISVFIVVTVTAMLTALSTTYVNRSYWLKKLHDKQD